MIIGARCGCFSKWVCVCVGGGGADQSFQLIDTDTYFSK